MGRGRKGFGTLDCETDPFHNCTDTTCKKCGGKGRVPQPFIWGAYNGATDEYREFATAKELAEFLARVGGTWFAHNGGKFDYHYLRDFANSDTPVLLINGRLARFHIGKAELRDSLNIFPNTRLKDFDDSTGAKIEIDYGLMEPDRRTDPNARAEISRYLKQDCVRLWGVVNRYRNEYGRSVTQATASMKYWEKMYDIQAPRQTKAQYEQYKPYYYGGRVQCFVSGVRSTDFSVADINSAYPFAMLQSHAISPVGSRQRHLPAEPELFRCLIKLDCTSRGAFPWRDPKTKELFFPDDEAGNRARMREYSITGWEFLTALELDAIKNIHIKEVHYFHQVIDFKKYIEHFYEQREQARKKGDVAGRIFGKYFMNSLYGKFGANAERYREFLIATTDTLQKWTDQGYRIYKPWGERFLMAREPTQEILNDTEQKRFRYYNVATAASVTGFVRAYLFRALSACSGLLYCDTDSIAARDTSKLQFGNHLGGWKDEGAYCSYAIAGKKLYAFTGLDGDYKVAAKGIGLRAETLEDRQTAAEVITKIALGEEYHHSPEVPTYSVTRNAPVFIPRTVKTTYKDISIAPELDI